MFLKVLLPFLAQNLERKFMPPAICGWRTIRKNKTKKWKAEVIFLLHIYFCLFRGKRTFCLVDCGRQLDCLPSSFTQFLWADKENGQSKAPFVCHSYRCFWFQEHSRQVAPQSVQQGSRTRIQPHAENCERRPEGKCSWPVFNLTRSVKPSLPLPCAPDDLGVLTTHCVRWLIICSLVAKSDFLVIWDKEIKMGPRTSSFTSKHEV